MLGGCLPEQANFQFGVSTSEIVGAVEGADGPPAYDDVLIVVFQTHYLFETPETQQRVYRVSAEVRGVDRDGLFRVPMPQDVVTLELIFIAPDRLSNEFRFNRQIGIGQVTYRAELPPHPNWYAHYYTYVQPMLSHLIVEPRYRLSQQNQQRLGDWLTAQSARMEALRNARAGAGPAGERTATPE
jgi:hypothetical protein